MQKFVTICVVSFCFIANALDLNAQGIPAAIDSEVEVKEKIVANPDAAKEVIKLTLQERADFSAIDTMSRSFSYEAYAVEPCLDMEEVEVTIKGWQVSYNGKPTPLIRTVRDIEKIPDSYYVILSGEIFAYNKKEYYYTLLINPRAVKLFGGKVIYLANMTSRVFFFDFELNRTAWAVNTNKETHGMFFPLYLTRDTISGNQYQGKYGQVVGYIRIVEK